MAGPWFSVDTAELWGNWSFSQLSSTVPGNGIASLAVAHAVRVLRGAHFLSPVGQSFRERHTNESQRDSGLSLSDSKKSPPPSLLTLISLSALSRPPSLSAPS